MKWNSPRWNSAKWTSTKWSSARPWPAPEAGEASAAPLPVQPEVGPYVGPRPIPAGRPLFGRDEETEALLDLLIAQRILLLHSPSGAGKTSLVQAKLIPALRDREQFRILGPARVNVEPPSGAEFAGANRYALSVLSALEKQRAAEPPLSTEELSRTTLADYLRDHGGSEDDPKVLILDQFEEILTLDTADHEAKEEFFRQLGTALKSRTCWALISMRDEYVAALEPYLRWLPTRLRTRYRLDLLRPEPAVEAVRRPAEAAGIAFPESAATILVDNLRQGRAAGTVAGAKGPFVEPVQLQVVCTRLWNSLPPGTTAISDAQVGNLGDVDAALSAYFAETVKKAARGDEAQERAIRRWVGTALVSGGVRMQMSAGAETKRGVPAGAVQSLLEAYLIRADERRGFIWYELAHDRLIEPIEASNREWFRERATQLERQAALWASTGEMEAHLLRGSALREAQRALATQADEASAEVRRFVDEAARKQRRRSWGWGAAGGAMALLGMLLLGLAWDQHRRAEDERLRADSLVRVAQTRQDSVELLLPVLWGLEYGDTAAVHQAMQIDREIQRLTAGIPPASRAATTIIYFLKGTDRDIEPALRDLDFTVEVRDGVIAAPTNAIAYGQGAPPEDVELVALALLRANLPLKRICPAQRTNTEGRVMQVLGYQEAAPLEPLTYDQVRSLGPERRFLNCPWLTE